MPTVTGHVEPATLRRGPETVPFEQAITHRRERPHAGARPEEAPQSFEDETQARAVDHGLLDELRRGSEATHTSGAADLGVAYESLPSLEVRRPYDTYEGEFSERDPGRARDRAPEPSYARRDADVWGRREDSGPRSRPVPPAPASSYAAPVPAYDDASISAQWGRDRAEPSQQGWSEPAPQNDVDFDPMIPPAPRLPEEMHPAFVVGVQPIRTATPDAWGTPHATAPQQGQYVPAPMQMQSPPPPYPAAQPQAYYPQPHYTQPPQYQPAHAQHVHPSALPSQPAGAYLQQSGPHARDPRYMTPMHASGMPRGLDSMRGPMSAQLDQASAANRVGRFAWFVAGAAFGITFAFFATGFFAGSGAPKDEFPAPPSLLAPAATVAPVAPPVPIAPSVPIAPVAPPVQAAAPVASPVHAAIAAAAPILTVSAAALPAAPLAALPAAAVPAVGFPAVVAPAVRPAPPPARPRFQAPPPRRPAPPVSQAPRSIGGGASGDDERAAAPSAPSGDIGDLLGAGLKP